MQKPSIATVEPGPRALVTAGAAGIGRAIAERLAEAGARLWVCDVDEGALGSCREAHPDWGHTQCDVADPEMLGRMFEELPAAGGGLDVLVNNAGIAGPTKPIEEISVEEWRRTIEINLNDRDRGGQSAADEGTAGARHGGLVSIAVHEGRRVIYRPWVSPGRASGQGRGICLGSPAAALAPAAVAGRGRSNRCDALSAP